MSQRWKELNQETIDHMQQGRFQEALEPARAAVAVARRDPDGQGAKLAVALNNLGELYLVLGDATEAEPVLRESIEVYEKKLGAEHPDVAEALYKLAEMFIGRKRYNDAEPLLKRALSVREKIQSEDHPDLVPVLSGLAEIDRVKGQYESALDLLKRAVAIIEKSAGTMHPALGPLLDSMARSIRGSRNWMTRNPCFGGLSRFMKRASVPSIRLLQKPWSSLRRSIWSAAIFRPRNLFSNRRSPYSK